jgi:hypothetical protein
LPYLLIPAALGLLTLVSFSPPWAAFPDLILVGVSQGMAGAVMTAVWAEVYGVESLGATKGAVATLGVVATALGPLALGILPSTGIDFDSVIKTCIAAARVVIAMVIGRCSAGRGWARISSQRPKRMSAEISMDANGSTKTAAATAKSSGILRSMSRAADSASRMDVEVVGAGVLGVELPRTLDQEAVVKRVCVLDGVLMVAPVFDGAGWEPVEF